MYYLFVWYNILSFCNCTLHWYTIHFELKLKCHPELQNYCFTSVIDRKEASGSVFIARLLSAWLSGKRILERKIRMRSGKESLAPHLWTALRGTRLSVFIEVCTNGKSFFKKKKSLGRMPLFLAVSLLLPHFLEHKQLISICFAVIWQASYSRCKAIWLAEQLCLIQHVSVSWVS